MNCQIFETVVNDLAREQMMEANAREQAIAHSGACESCARRLTVERRLTFELRALAAEMKSVEAPARVEAHLLLAFRTQASSRVQRRARGPQAGRPLGVVEVSRKRYWVAAAAAVLLLAFGIAGMRWRLEGPPQNAHLRQTAGKMPALHDSETTKATKAEAGPQDSTVAIGRANTGSTPKQKTFPFRRPRRTPAVQSAARHSANRNNGRFVARGSSTTSAESSGQGEVATQFLPLSYVSPVNLQEGGQIVRVEFSRSAMASLGLPVNMDRYNEKVKADVLVSADGLARAIRFVQ